MRKITQENEQEQGRKSPVYIYVLLVSAAFLFYNLFFGHISDNPKLLWGAFIFLALLLWAYLDVAYVFLATLFFLPVLIGQNNYQINIGSFLGSFLPISELYIDPFSLASLFLVFLSGIELLKRIKKLAQAPLFFILSLVIILELATFVTSKYKLTGAVFELYLLAGFMSYFLGYFLLVSKRNYLRLIFTALFSAIIPSIFAVYQLASGNYLYEGDSTLGRITGTFPHSNTYGSFLFIILTIALAASFAIRKKKPKKEKTESKNIRIMKWAFIFFMGALLLLTFSRTAWIGFALSVLAIAIMRPKIRIPIVLFGSLGITVLMFFEKFRDRIFGIFDHYMYDSMYGRYEIWDMALYAARKKPMMGYGIGSFEEVIREVQGKETGNVYPHNDTVRFFLEGGLAGVFSYLLYMAGAIFYAAKSFLKYPKGDETIDFFGTELTVDFKLLGMIPLMLFAIMVVISMVEAPSMDFVYQIFAWTMLGSWLGMNRKQAVQSKSS
ncbi:MAG: O-antigen ligase family protein [Candidatus Moranbacteria bacterium]|nr:O-antigen ligase family protein [Candidatus Moranbacteria bacterium]